MSSGTFGSIRPANITPSTDVEILYTYRPTRSTEDEDFKNGYKTLDASECLKPCYKEDGTTPIAGIYDVRLPLDKFNKKGFYKLCSRPICKLFDTIFIGKMEGYSRRKRIKRNGKR